MCKPENYHKKISQTKIKCILIPHDEINIVYIIACSFYSPA